ncbi:MAG: Zn-ribbon domain-containing OB-fold protein [Candidatus Abyssobacteria bacterium SURF_17]|uniref:Zn-ribbon domain-containing OB-fold protein n=1 Tax=Candidatus Abyssobacteria bacterium SURF_17 TaxID=2093361 RepID=A0A419EV59_9BACT|nr:MAG: Zn-ribbon domain-containing OB-fold protein [Candidatus Abyssubacteria bacterium SURF_17]
MPEYLKPMPVPDHITETFWAAARQHKLLIQQCRDCGRNQFFPQSSCRACLSENLEWVEASGSGKVYSYTIIHRPPSASFEEDAPYTVALVELGEGVRMMSNIIEIEPDQVRVGMPVHVVFEDISPTISLPKFRPAAT